MKKNLEFYRKYIDDGKAWIELSNGFDVWDELACEWEYVIDLCGSINGGKSVASYYRSKDGRIAIDAQFKNSMEKPDTLKQAVLN